MIEDRMIRRDHMHTTEETIMNTATQTGLLRAAKTCIAEAQRADRRGDFRYAEGLRASARSALAELDAMTPAPVDPELAAAQAKARAYAKVVLAGFGQVH